MEQKCYHMREQRWQSRGASIAWFRAEETDTPWPGAVSLTVIGEMARPMIVPSPKGPITAVGPGFHWLQFAPRDEHWWLTAMYNERRELVQFYFDLTLENHILPHGDSWCEDAWLDLVIEPDGTAHLLDEEELAAARDAGAISFAGYEAVRNTAERLRRRYTGRAGELLALTRPWIEQLLPQE
ncbi:MAG: DUF402 domain-containing protein [Ruminococcaceae bacterium]|nr:DUF402 domain-containing protein [Oscillospiraceae bacterium]